MNPEIETIINEQLKSLPEDVISLFADPIIVEKISEIAKGAQLNIEQIDLLQMETSLLMLALTNKNEFEGELKNKLIIPDDKLKNILEEIYILISPEILEKLNNIYNNEEGDSKIINNEIEEQPKSVYDENKPILKNPNTQTYDIKKINKRFEVLPKNLQEAISKSDYETKIYEISQKYKLPIDQMGILEESIIKTILGDINLNGLDLELKLKITLPDEEISALVNDVNTEIFKKIRMLLRFETSDVPLPPYKEEVPGDNELKIIEDNPIAPTENKKIEEENIPLPNYNDKIEEIKIPLPAYEKKLTQIDEKELYKEHGIEMMEGESFKDDETLDKHIETEEDHDHFRDSGIDIIGHKLVSPTVSTPTISDYTLPKMGQSITNDELRITNGINNEDKYREQV